MLAFAQLRTAFVHQIAEVWLVNLVHPRRSA